MTAGIKDVYVVRLVTEGQAEPEWSAELLAAFELAGVENVHSMNRSQLEVVAEHLSVCAPGGVVLSFGEYVSTLVDGFFTRRSVLHKNLPVSPTLWIWSEDDLSLRKDIIEQFYQSTIVEWCAEDKEKFLFSLTNNPDAIMINDEIECFKCQGLNLDVIPLVFGRGMEGRWLWPDITSEFFRTSRCYLSVIETI